jgi:hypothetical protein
MRRAAFRVGILLAVAGSAACRDEPPNVPSTGGSDVPTAPRSGTAAPVRKATSAPAEEMTGEALAALLAQWEAAEDDAARRAAEAKILAGGDRALARLVLMLGDEAHPSAEMLVPRFGKRAIAPLLAGLGTAQGDARGPYVLLLQQMATVWRDAPEGAEVARSLFALIRDESVGDDAAGTLARSGAAGSIVARDLAGLVLNADENVRERAILALGGLGTHGAPAAPLLVAAMDWQPKPRDPAAGPDDDSGMAEAEAAAERCARLTDLLRGIGSANPSILDALRKLLSPATFPPVRTAAASVLRTWGDVAAPAAPELLALLGTPEEGEAAAAALCAMPSVREQVWSSLADAVRAGKPWTRDPATWDSLIVFAGDRAFADRLAALLPAVSSSVAATLHAALVEGDTADLAPYAAALVTHSDASVRWRALDVWAERDGAPPLPSDAAKWLEDPDPAVRAKALHILLERDGAPDATLAKTARTLLADGDAAVRADAVRALGALAADDPAALDIAVFTLSTDPDDAVRQAAADGLAWGSGTIAGEHRELVEWLAAQVAARIADGDDVASTPNQSICRTLLRLESGDEALAAAIGAALDAVRTGAWPEAWALWAAQVAGPRVASLQSALERRRGASTAERERMFLDLAIAVISEDPDRIALSGFAGEEMFPRLLAMGPPGRRAVVLLAGSPRSGWRVAEALAGVSLADEILEAANAAAPDPHAEQRRLGAARLARSLSGERALAVWTMLAADPAGAVRGAVLFAMCDQEEETAGSVPASLVVRFLDDPAFAGEAALLAGRLGARAAEVVPALRRIRDEGDVASAPHAAIALWKITKSASEAQPTLRELLATPDPAVVPIQWTDVAAALGEMPLGKADLDALLAALVGREFRFLGAIQFLVAIVPLLERFGADAAPAVPVLRRMLAYRDDEGGVGAEYGECAARVLGAIGTAARPALPDLRKWMAEFRDPNGVGAEAVRKIEASATQVR